MTDAEYYDGIPATDTPNTLLVAFRGSRFARELVMYTCTQLRDAGRRRRRLDHEATAANQRLVSRKDV